MIDETKENLNMENTEIVKSGSHNDHARLSPSGSKTWTSCTQSPFFIEANQDSLMRVYVGRVNRLAPYLRSIPQEELKAHELEAMQIAAEVEAGTLKTEDFTPHQARCIKKTESSKAAREGTRAHDFAAAILSGQKTVGDIPEEFREPVGDYVKRCLRTVPRATQPMIEVEIPLFYDPKSTGTADFAVVTDNLVVVRDLKFGQGVLVSAQGNTQLAVYGLSLMEMFADLYAFSPATKVILAIDQPRHHEAADTKPWELTYADLIDFCRDIQVAATRIHERQNLSFEPSEDACRWCDGKFAGCKAHEKWSSEGCDLPDMGFEELVNLLPDLTKEESKKPAAERFDVSIDKAGSGTISYEKRVTWYRNMDRIVDFLNTNKEALELELLGGAEIEGVGLRMGREGNRDWADESAADTFLTGQKITADDRYTRKLISPTQAEKLLKDKTLSSRAQSRFATLVTRSAARKVIALADDKRPAIVADVATLPDLSEDDCSFE